MSEMKHGVTTGPQDINKIKREHHRLCRYLQLRRNEYGGVLPNFPISLT